MTDSESDVDCITISRNLLCESFDRDDCDKNQGRYRWCVCRHFPSTIILLRSVCLSVCLSVLANGRSLFLLDRLGDVSNCSYRLTVHVSSHEFASQFGPAFVIREKHPKTIAKTDPRSSVY